MTSLDDLLDELKVKINSLLDDAKDEGFKAGKEAGANEVSERIKNALDSKDYPLQSKKANVKGKQPKKKEVEKKPESVIKKEVITESVTKIGKPTHKEAFNEAVKLFKEEDTLSSAIKKFKASKTSFYNHIKKGVKQGLISQEEYDSKKDKRGGERKSKTFIKKQEEPAQIEELDSKKEEYPEQVGACKSLIREESKPHKPLIVSEPKKEYEEPDPAEVEMNLKIIREEGAKKPSREWIPCKVCGNNTPGWGDNGGVCKKCRGKEVLEPKKKEEVKPKLEWIPCVICGGKIKEVKRDGNVCKTCRGEADEFSVSTVSKMGNYNIRCKECGIGKPKKEFRGGYGVCKKCRGLK